MKKITWAVLALLLVSFAYAGVCSETASDYYYYDDADTGDSITLNWSSSTGISYSTDWFFNGNASILTDGTGITAITPQFANATTLIVWIYPNVTLVAARRRWISAGYSAANDLTVCSVGVVGPDAGTRSVDFIQVGTGGWKSSNSSIPYPIQTDQEFQVMIQYNGTTCDYFARNTTTQDFFYIGSNISTRDTFSTISLNSEGGGEPSSKIYFDKIAAGNMSTGACFNDSTTLDNCSVNTFLVHNFSFFTIPQSPTTINFSALVEYTIGTNPANKDQNYTWNNQSTSSMSVCAARDDVQYIVDYTIQYASSTTPGGNTHSFLVENVYLGNQNPIRQTSLYVESATDVLAQVFDNQQNKVEGAFIEVLRFDFSTNSFLSVGTYKTNFEGEAILPLVLDTVFYKFNIYYPYGTLKKSTQSTYIYSTSIQFQISLYDDILPGWYDTLGIPYSLTFNNATNNFSFSYSDPSLSVTQGCLEVIRKTALLDIPQNKTCVNSNAGTILGGVNRINGSTWYAVASVQLPTGEEILDTLYVSFPDTVPFKDMGLFSILLLTIVFAFISTFSIPISLILMPMPLILGSILGLVSWGVGIGIGILILALVFAIMINQRG